MEYGIKVDPTKQLKVFDAAQVSEALITATARTMDDVKDKLSQAQQPILSILVIAVVALMSQNVEKALGIDGTSGAYIDGK